MKNLHHRITLAVLLLLFSGASSAITIDFESVSDGDLTPIDPVSGERYFSTDGFDFSTTFGGIGSDAGDQYLFATSPGQLFAPGPTITFERTDDQAFALFSMDLDCLACTIRGVRTGGGFLDTTDVNDLGSGDWLDLTSVFVFDPRGEEGLSLRIEIDNVAVGAAVPIPAAVWLFGSALAGLGWIRRRKDA